MSTEKIRKVEEWIDDFEKNRISDEGERRIFRSEMKSFLKLYKRALIQNDTRSTIVWDDVRPIEPDLLLQYSNIPKIIDSGNCRTPHNLSNLVVLKLCGGLGTTMGLGGPKALVEVTEGKTFLDFAIEQLIIVNKKHGVEIPLLLMTSFFTHEAIVEYISKHPLKENLKIYLFKQKKFPRLSEKDFLPISTDYSDPSQWNPPGHGDVYHSLLNSPIYEKLRNQNISDLFISNIDNLGAIVDESIYHHFKKWQFEFCLEVTRKTLNDVKGGTVVQLNNINGLKLLELAQVPENHLEEFFSIDKFRIFNTNSMWVSLETLDRCLEKLTPPVIFNRKKWKDMKIVQLETACGCAIECFEKVLVVQVPRIRRVTVKNCQDLFLAQSGLYDLVENKTRFVRRLKVGQEVPSALPIIRFVGEEWRDLKVYNERIARFGIPNIEGLKRLELRGNVVLKGGSNIRFEGEVLIDGSENEVIRLD